jgi:hypothetical protein
MERLAFPFLLLSLCLRVDSCLDLTILALFNFLAWPLVCSDQPPLSQKKVCDSLQNRLIPVGTYYNILLLIPVIINKRFSLGYELKLWVRLG